jgi:Tol biopolymer transport system component
MRATTRWIGLAIMAGLATACSPASSTPPGEGARASVLQYPIEDFMATTRIGGGWFSPDGNTLLFHSNQTGVFNLYAVPVAGGQPTQLTRSRGQTSDVLKVDWDIQSADFSKSGKYMTVAVNNDARTELRVLDAATMKPVPLDVGSDTNVNAARFSADERRMALLVNDSRTPTDLFVADVGSAPRRLTSSLSPRSIGTTW